MERSLDRRQRGGSAAPGPGTEMAAATTHLPGTKRFFLMQWVTLIIAFLILAAFVAASLHTERKRILANAEDRLALGAKSIAFALERRLDSIDRGLRDIRENLRILHHHDERGSHIAMQLAFFQRAVEGVRSAMIIDADGVVVLASDPHLVGRDLASTALFRAARTRPNSAAADFSAPEAIGQGTLSATLSHAIVELDGRFAGLVVAELDLDALEPVLAALRYTPDVSAGLVHRSGKTLLYVSSPAVPSGTDFSAPDTFFSRHWQSGRDASLLSGTCQVLPNERLAAVHTVPALAPDSAPPLVAIVSQEYDTVLAPWHTDLRNRAGLLGLLIISAVAALAVHQRRQRRLVQMTRQYQADRQHAAERLQFATEASGTGIWELDVRTMALTCDDTIYRLYGREKKGVGSAYATWREDVLPEDLPAAEAALQYAIQHGEDLEMVFRAVRGDGQVRVMEVLARLFKDENGKPLRLIGVNRDITRQRRIEQSLRENKDLLVGVLDSLVEHVAVLDDKGHIVAVNRAWVDFSAENGGPGQAADIVGHDYFELRNTSPASAQDEDTSRIGNGVRAVLAGEWGSFAAEYENKAADRHRWFHIQVTPLQGGKRGAVIALEDITNRKLAEEARQRAQRVTQQFLDHMPGLAYVRDESHRFVLANRQFKTLFGIDPSDAIGKTSEELYPEAMGRKVAADDRRVLRTGRSAVIDDHFFGRHYESNKFVIEDDSGKRLLGGITLDVTQRRKHSERQDALLALSELGGTVPEHEFLHRGLEMAVRLTESQAGFACFVDESQEGLEFVAATWLADDDLDRLEWRRRIDEAGAWAQAAKTGNAAVFNRAPDGPASALPPECPAMERLIAIPVAEQNRVRAVLCIGGKAADYDDFDCASAQLIGNDLWRIVHRIRAEVALQQKVDELVSLNARLDETNNRLLQSEKLAAIGQLAAGVAHEINNPIGYVSSNLNSLTGYVADLLAIDEVYGEIEARYGVSMPRAFERVHQLKAEADHGFIVSDIRHLLDESREGLARVRQIVSDLKDFSRIGATGWEWVDLHAGLESTLNIVWNEIKYKAEVDRQYGELPPVRCIPSQINQVFLNLLTNAAQSIEGHGRIVLRSACEGRTVWIEIEDNGCGIAPESLEHIFEPFYTTKPVGSGTGLGLSLSWSIVQRHQGKIEARSVLGRGSVFRVTLPIDPQPADETQAETAS